MGKYCYSIILNQLDKHKYLLYWCLFLTCLYSSPALAQQTPQQEKDSLLKLLKTLPEDTNKVNVLNKLCFVCARDNSKKALDYGKKSFTLAHQINFQHGLAYSLFYQGFVHRRMGNYNDAINYQQKAKKILIKLTDSLRLADCYRELGIVHRFKGNYPKSLDFFIQTLTIFEALKYKRGIASTSSSIGRLYFKQKNYSESMSYHKRSLALHKELKSEKSMGIDYNNIGDVYSALSKHDTALFFYEKYKEIQIKVKDQRRIAIALSNIGYIKAKQKKYNAAIILYKKSLYIRNKLGQKKRQTYPLQYLAEAYASLKNFKQALHYGFKALKISEETGSKSRTIEILATLSKIYKNAKDYQKALEYYQKHKSLNDSVFNEKTSQQMAEMKTKYETEKQKQENEYLKKEGAKNKALLRQRTNLVVAITFGALLLIILAMVLYQSNQRKQRTNQVLVLQKQEIEVQTEEILAQRDMLEQQHKDIRDSINYARKIQTAILPLSEEISAAIPEHFIFYKPRDIVSGDFYWFARVHNEETGHTKYVISASDCTGHGVPGAFMSMIGNDLLNDLVKARQITQPDVILNKLHKGVRKALHQESSENTDGMDISLCVIDPTEKTISYAGANSALVYVKNGERTRIAPDQTSIGGDMPSFQKGFAAHCISYADAPVMCYLYTDGYRDQFGGERGKKFLRSRMQELIFYISQLSMQEQRRQVEDTMHTWMTEGGFEQMDDMLVMGFRLS